jgi:hypothetical protein
MNNFIGTSGWGPLTKNCKYGKYPHYEQTYYATSLADVNFSGSIYYNNGWNVEYTVGNPCMARCSIDCEVQSDGMTPVTGQGSFVTVNWSVKVNTIDKELLETNQLNGSSVFFLNNLTTADKVQLQSQINNNTGSLITSSNGVSMFSSGGLAVAEQVWTMTKNGVKSIPVIEPVIRKTIVIPSNYDLTTFYTNINRIYSVGTMNLETNMLPNIYAQFSPQTADPAPLVTEDGQWMTLQYGFKKLYPEMDQNGQTITLSQEWVWGLWFYNMVLSRL